MRKILQGLDVFNKTAVKITKWIVSACIAAQILIIFAGVIWRYFLNAPLSWVDEMGRCLTGSLPGSSCLSDASRGSAKQRSMSFRK